MKNKTILISKNKKAYYEYFIEKKIECGIILQGWEIKSIRSKKTNINNSYIIIKSGEAYLLGAVFTPLSTVLQKYDYDTHRNRKLLLHRKEIDYLQGKIKKDRSAIIALSLFIKNAWCKLSVGIAKGKSNTDKRFSEKEKEWKILQLKINKNKNKYLK
ncbi:SsrA-binding protein [Buchnera aphidicola (Thelaxes suberi)]|uniref:SsrA-binding protein SmpB n=1 Tax=Buchnera aphidicola TaxID=9 RepID=UPI0034641BE1